MVINPIVGVNIPIIRMPVIKGGMTIPNIRSWSTLAHIPSESVLRCSCSTFTHSLWRGDLFFATSGMGFYALPIGRCEKFNSHGSLGLFWGDVIRSEKWYIVFFWKKLPFRIFYKDPILNSPVQWEPCDSSRDLLIPDRWRSPTTLERVT